MHSDDHLRNDIRAALNATAIPAVAITAILRRRDDIPKTVSSRPRLRVGLAVAAALIVVVLPFVHPDALIAAAASDVQVVLRAIGLPAASPIPKPLLKEMREQSHLSDIAEASREVDFTLAAPSGLPVDARRSSLYVSTQARFAANHWRIGEKVAIWTYTRANGTTFALHAARYDSHDRFYAYMWEIVEDPHGNAVMVHGHVKAIRHDAFFWRNGDQVMSAFTGKGVNAQEIAAIRAAMHGVAVPTIRTDGPQPGPKRAIIKKEP